MNHQCSVNKRKFINPIAYQKNACFLVSDPCKKLGLPVLYQVTYMIDLIAILRNFTQMNEMGIMSWKCQDLQNILEFGLPAHTHVPRDIFFSFT